MRIKKQQKHFLFKHRLSNGEIRHVEVHSAPIIFSDKKYLYSIVHDITDKIKNEKTILEKEKLTAAISAIGAVCHEMNQPLMSIMGFAELLLEKSSMSKMEISYLKEIKTQTERLRSNN